MKRLKILFLAQVFPPEIGACRMIYTCARELGRAGHEITVISALPNYPTGVIPKEYRGKWSVLDRMDDCIDVHRVFIIPVSNRKHKKRLVSFLSFMCSSFIKAMSIRKKFDVIVAVSPPLTVGVSTLLAAKLRRTPSALYMTDLEPESALALGHFKDGFVVKVSRFIAKKLYRWSRLLITFSEGARKTVSGYEFVDEDKVKVLTGGVDVDLFCKMERDQDLSQSLGLDGCFTVVYTGTFGRIQNLPTLIEAAAMLRDEEDIRFVLVGDGEERSKLEELVRSNDLSGSVIVLPSRPTEEIPRFISIADLCVTTVKKTELHEGIIPAKILEYCASGKPVLAAIDGETKTLLETHKAGVCVPPEDPGALAREIIALKGRPDLREAMGPSGRDMVVKLFSNKVMGKKLEEMLSQISPVRSSPDGGQE